MKPLHMLFFISGCGLSCGLGAATGPAIDHQRMIKESGDFRKRREPEMSSSEQAVYEKVAPILATRPAFALKLLTAMSSKSAEGESRPSPAFEFMLGNAYYAASNYPEAEVKYKNTVNRSPTFIRAWNNLGVLYYLQNRYKEAVPCFSTSVALGDRDPTTFGLLGNSFEKTGNTVSAEMSYMQALATEPANVNWTEGLLRIYLAGKQLSKAEPLVRSLVKDHPREAKYQLTYVNLLLSSKRPLEAIAVLEEMSATGLARQEDFGLLADLYAEQKMTPEALAVFGKVATWLPSLAEQKLLQYARRLIAERNWDGASEVLDGVAKTSLSHQGVIAYREARGEVAIAQRNWIGAKSELEALIREAPENGNAWIGMGRIYLAEAEQTKAIGAFEHAYQIQESSYRASIELANIEFKNHRYDRSLVYLEHALGIQRSSAVESFRNQIKSLIPPEKQSQL
jgi:predicted Zn-dependent protease